MAGGVHGRGHAWGGTWQRVRGKGECMAGGMCDRVCIVGMCMAGGHAW